MTRICQMNFITNVNVYPAFPLPQHEREGSSGLRWQASTADENRCAWVYGLDSGIRALRDPFIIEVDLKDSLTEM